MTAKPTVWMRHETRSGEGRAPISPDDARTLVTAGFRIVVEESPSRVFPTADYEAAGCLVAPADSWPDAPEGAIVLGLKELAAADVPLRDHIFFGSAFKGEKGAERLLRRFSEGGGTLYDLEYLVDETGHRVAAFTYWAGYVGAALAVLTARGELPRVLAPTTKPQLDAMLAAGAPGVRRTALVLGARGRGGTGAVDALRVAGIEPTQWDREETRELDKAAILEHDILVNAVRVSGPITPFLTTDDLDAPDRRLGVISDVSCSANRERSVLPLYHEPTTWRSPVLEVRGGSRPVKIIAIDNLARLLPLESSLAYSRDLLPTLASLPDGPVWQRARDEFRAHVPSLVAC